MITNTTSKAKSCQNPIIYKSNKSVNGSERKKIKRSITKQVKILETK